MSSNLLQKEVTDVESMSGDDYDKASIVVNELQYQVEEKNRIFKSYL